MELESSLSEIIADPADWEKCLTFSHTQVRPMNKVFKSGGHPGLELSTRKYKVKIDNRRQIDTCSSTLALTRAPSR